MVRPLWPPGTRIQWPFVTAPASMGRMPDDHNPPGGISARLVSFSADCADLPGINDYDSFAETYAACNENNLVNAYYERPAMLALAGDVAGRRILDAGCGSGPLFAALRDRGAIVTGIDKSAGMLELARRRLGDGADLQVAELGSPLPFPDDTFDDVTASLVLHYLEDWDPALAELRRVLKPGGRLIVSVNHPFAEALKVDGRFDGQPADGLGRVRVGTSPSTGPGAHAPHSARDPCEKTAAHRARPGSKPRPLAGEDARVRREGLAGRVWRRSRTDSPRPPRPGAQSASPRGGRP
jgi:SAM-dependent methyltransferase